MHRILVLVAVAVSLVAGCAARPATPHIHAPYRVRVMTYNIHHGEGSDGKFDLNRIAKVINEADADVVALQEVDQGTSRATGVRQAAELTRLTGMRSFFASAMPYDGGEYGEAILTRLPADDFQRIALRADPGFEPRAAAALTCTLASRDGRPISFRFVGTHLDHTEKPDQRLMQIADLTKALQGIDIRLPQIVVGDFNCEPGTEEYKLLTESWNDSSAAAGSTFPSDKPTKRIDYVLTSKNPGLWRVISVRTVSEPIASDHRPIVIDLEWVPPDR